MVNIEDLGNNKLFLIFLVKNYDPSQLREVINKKKTKDGKKLIKSYYLLEVISDFIKNFEIGTKQGKITIDEMKKLK